MRIDLILQNIGQLVTCAADGKPKKGAAMGDVGLIENGAVGVKDGIIVAVGKSDKLLREYTSEMVVDVHQKVVCPSFVECHTHIVYAGDRINEFELRIKGATYLEIMEAGGGIVSTMKHTREAALSELVGQSRRRLDQLLKLGVTTCEVKTGYGLNTETELKMLEAIIILQEEQSVDLIPTFLAAHAIPPEYKGREDDFTDLICREMLPNAAERLNNSYWYSKNKTDETFAALPFFADVFCEKNAFTLEQSKRVLAAAKSLGFKLKAHVDEFTNLGGARMAVELGAASIDHLDMISDEEIALLAASDTIGVVTPTVNFNFGSTEFADARKMIDNNCAIALSTDFNPGSAPCPSLPNAMAIACRYQKMMPSEALNAVTINAAFAVGLGDKIGSIEVGKQANILILDAEDYRATAYEFGGNCIKTVIKNGKRVN